MKKRIRTIKDALVVAQEKGAIGASYDYDGLIHIWFTEPFPDYLAREWDIDPLKVADFSYVGTVKGETKDWAKSYKTVKRRDT